MKKVSIKSLLISSILVLNCSSAEASDLSALPTLECSERTFNISTSCEEHPRYDGHTLVLQNKTGDSLDYIRILAMFKKDPQQPFMPENVTTVFWRFSPSDIEVALPLPHLGFSLVIYAGAFDDETPLETALIEKPNQALLMVDGETLDENVRTINLSVCSVEC